MIDEKITQKKLDEIRTYTSRKNWDGNNSDPLENVLFHRTTNLISDLKCEFPALPQPTISPCSDQTIHLSWKNLQFRFLIEVGLNQYDWYYVDLLKNSEEGTYKDTRSIIDLCKKFIGQNNSKEVLIKNLEFTIEKFKKEYTKIKNEYDYLCDLKDRINNSYELNQRVKVHYEVSDRNSIKDLISEGSILEILNYGKKYIVKLDNGEIIESDHYLISKLDQGV